MANTKISTKLKEFTDKIVTEQMKQVEEAIIKQNDAIDKLSQKLEDVISSVNKQKTQPQEGLSKAEHEAIFDKYISYLTGKLAEKMKNSQASFRGEVTALRNERKAEQQELLNQRAHQHKVFIRIAIPTVALIIFFIRLPSLPQQFRLFGKPGIQCSQGCVSPQYWNVLSVRAGQFRRQSSGNDKSRDKKN